MNCYFIIQFSLFVPSNFNLMFRFHFAQENIVKLQVLNLAVKLFLTNPQQSESLCRYLFNLARYDENYDIRDRARFLKPFIFPTNGGTILSKQAKRIFLSAKPAPSLVSQYCREQFQLGSLAHYLNARTTGYHDLPPFPKIAPDSSVRGVENTENNFDQNDSPDLENRSAKTINKSNKKETFYSNSENENDSSSSNESGSDDSSSEESESDENESKTGSKSGTDSGSDDESSDNSSEEASTDDSSESEDNESASSSTEKSKSDHKPIENAKKTTPQAKAERSNLDLLLDLGDIAPTAPIMTPSLGGFLTPMSGTANVPLITSSRFELVGPIHVSLDKRELLNKTNSHGLQINYRFTRAPHLYSAKMVSIELTFHNESTNEMENIHLSDKLSVPANVSVCDFAPIAKLAVDQRVQGIVGVDFNDSTQPISFGIKSSVGSAKVSLKTSVGELIRAVRLAEATFKEEQVHLRGMNEHTCKLDVCPTTAAIQHKIFEVANLALCANNSTENGDVLLFAGQTMSSQSLVLVTVDRSSDGNAITITVNCEKMVIGSMLLNEIKNSIKG